VWSTNVEATGVTVTATVSSVTDVATPTFGICDSPSGNVCTISDLPVNAPQELLAGSAVGADAVAGAQITLTATVTAPGSTSYETDATVTVGSAANSSSSSSDSSGLSPLGVIPALPSFELPGSSVTGPANGEYTTPTNPSALFPSVSPTKHHKKSASHKAVTDSAILPLNSHLIDGQVAGLVVLVGAIAIAVVRLSLRSRPRDSAAAHQDQNATPST
jgi:hypothetical protein